MVTKPKTCLVYLIKDMNPYVLHLIKFLTKITKYWSI